MKNIFLLTIILIFGLSTKAQSAKDFVKVTDMLKTMNVGNISICKDGSKAAFTVTSIEPDEKSKLDFKYISQVYYISTKANETPIQLTSTKEGATQPAWSPDGNRLAFVRTIESKPQIFILSMKGGEPLQLTKNKYGASNPKWSPDGQQILFSSSIAFPELLNDTLINSSQSLPKWSLERPGFANNEILINDTAKANPDGNLQELRAYLEKDATDKKAIVLNKLNFQNESSISAELNINVFYVINITKGAEPMLITKGFNRYNTADFLPGGKQIILSGNSDTLESPDRSLESEIFICDVNGQNLKKLLGEKGKRYSNAVVSHSGKSIAFLVSSTSIVTIDSLYIMPINGSVKDMMLIPYDRNKNNLTWSTDDKNLYFNAQSNGGTPLHRVNLSTGKIEILSGFDAGITSFDVSIDKIIYARTDISNPSEVFVADLVLKNSTQVSSFNEWIKTKNISLPQKYSFKNKKGLEIEYWVMKPANYEVGKKYPLLLEIHGGPASMWGPGEASMWHEYQYFCSKGYGIVYSNPAGSGGYGVDFLRSNINDWGTGPADDVLTALDKTVAQGWADTSKLLITGGSYAGYLTAWIISHDKRFAAACSQRGVYDLATFFGEGNAWRLVPLYFGGYPWEQKTKEMLVRESPITYVQNITTPYIIFHGGNDRRTGFVQGEMMFRSLKVLGRPVEYVVHPGATHEITRSGDNRQRIDQMLRTYEFFERWIRK